MESEGSEEWNKYKVQWWKFKRVKTCRIGRCQCQFAASKCLSLDCWVKFTNEKDGFNKNRNNKSIIRFSGGETGADWVFKNLAAVAENGDVNEIF